uniref:C2H2-type domain-containing protein n=1 Tax=Schistocephalus solidus TaxID=70667 RepID=A0A183S875_SCHSO
LPTYPRCQRVFRARISLVGHLRTQCTNNPTIPISTSNSANPPSDSLTLTPGINSITPTIIETKSIYSSPVNPTTATTTAFAFNTTTTTISDGESLRSCTQCDRTFTARIDLVGNLRKHRTETGEPVPGAPPHSRDRRLNCLHCARAFTHRMGLFGHMRIHDSGIHHNADNTDTSCTPSAPAILSAPATPTIINDMTLASSDFSWPHCTQKLKLTHRPGRSPANPSHGG